MSFFIRFAWGFGLSLLVALPAWKKGSLSASGTVSAVVLGSLLTAAGDLRFFALLMAFFLSSSVLGKILPRRGGRERKVFEGVERIVAKGSRRDHTQVIATGAVPLAFAILYRFMPGDLFYIGFSAAIAASTADTWASEIGPLSRVPPVFIVSRRRAEPGISGGVSALGFAASAGGSMLIAALAALLRGKADPAAVIVFALVLLGGFLGSVVDSIIGELLQAKYDDGGTLTERRFNGSAERRLVGGLRFMTNNLVNFLSVLLASQSFWLAGLTMR